MTTLLAVRDVTVRYGPRAVVRGVSVDVEQGSVVSVIGPNGAGKTTLIDAIGGFVPAAAGGIWLDGTSIGHLPPHRRAALGLGRTFQSLELFEDLTVAENLLVGARGARGRERRSAAEGDDGIGAGLGTVAERLPALLPHGRRKELALARALAGRPRVLLLDEPAAGLDRSEREALAGNLRRLADTGLGVLVVDHDTDLVLEVSDRVVVLDFGTVIASGPPAVVRADERVVAAYLGRRGGATAVVTPPAPGADASEGSSRDPATLPVPAPSPAAEAPRAPALEVSRLSVGYAGIPAVHDVSLHVAAGEVVALLGPNGAGKTSTLLGISGVLRPSGGAVRLLGVDTVGPPHARARRGLAHVLQGRGSFPSLTVAETLRLASRRHRSRPDPEEVLELFPALRELLARRTGDLSGGEQQMLSLARALVGRPRVLLVDEMSMGLAPLVVGRLLAALRRVADEEGTAVVVVEQHVHLALEVADRAYVLQRGRVVLEGPARELARRPQTLEASYLGGQASRPLT